MPSPAARTWWPSVTVSRRATVILVDAAAGGARAAQCGVDGVGVQVDGWLGGRRRCGRRDAGDGQGGFDAAGEFRGVAHGVDVGPPDRRGLLQQMLVEGCLLDPGGLERVGDLGQFVLGDHQVAHEHGPVAVLGERRVPPSDRPGLIATP